MSDIQALDSTKITLEEINLKKEELKEIDESIQHYQDIIKFAEAIKALQADENYKLVFEDGYFTKEAERLTKNLLEPTILKRDQIENIVDMVTAIRNVKTFLHYKLLDAATAEENIEQLQIMRSEVNSK